jgi:hypothetical protein
MWQQRVAVITYHKFPGEAWAAEEFIAHPIKLVNGEEVTLELAERGTQLSNGLWVREVRHRDASGHQTAVLATDFQNALDRVAAAMFARWCQENFFKYMQEHYSLDRLVEYGTQPLPETTRVVNPTWRTLDSQVRRQAALLIREQAQFTALSLPMAATPEKASAYEQLKGQLLQSLLHRQQTLGSLKDQRRQTPRHVLIKDLPEADRFSQLRTDKKHFVDTIKLLAYRSETALALVAREKLARLDDARAFMRQVFQSSADLRPDHQQKTLTVNVHRLSTASHDAVMEHLCAELTATETIFPGTDLRLIYQPVGSG